MHIMCCGGMCCYRREHELNERYRFPNHIGDLRIVDPVLIEERLLQCLSGTTLFYGYEGWAAHHCHSEFGMDIVLHWDMFSCTSPS
jgi:hypothetical protein